MGDCVQEPECSQPPDSQPEHPHDPAWHQYAPVPYWELPGYDSVKDNVEGVLDHEWTEAEWQEYTKVGTEDKGWVETSQDRPGGHSDLEKVKISETVELYDKETEEIDGEWEGEEWEGEKWER